jgi:AraC-like DNA-binding protein
VAAILNSPVEAVAAIHAAGVEITHHAHDSGQLSLELCGTLSTTTEEGWWLAPPGLAIWAPPKMEHGSRYSESSSLLFVRLSSAFAVHLSDRCGAVVVSDLLRELAGEAVRSSSFDRQVHKPQQAPGLFVPHGQDRRLRRAIDILWQDPGRDINLDELASRAHTSSRTLGRLFTTETNMTFRRRGRRTCWNGNRTAVRLPRRRRRQSRQALQSHARLLTSRSGVPYCLPKPQISFDEGPRLHRVGCLALSG